MNFQINDLVIVALRFVPEVRGEAGNDTGYLSLKFGVRLATILVLCP